MARVLAILVALLFPLPAFAQITLPVHNTGVDGSDALVVAGAQTAFWTLQTIPAGGTETIGSNPFRYFTGPYAPDSSVSAWVSPAASGNASVGGIYLYQLLVDVTGFDPATVVIAGQFATDNDGFIRVNGGANAATTGFAGFGSLTNFTLNSGFVAGVNSIQVGVNNGGNPTAFRVEFTQATATPIPPVPTMPDVLFLVLAIIVATTAALALRRRPRTA